MDKKLESIEKREAGFAAKEEEINRQKAEVARLHEERVQELERISGLTSEQAKDYLLKMIEDDVKLDTAKLIKEMDIKRIHCNGYSEMRCRSCGRDYDFRSAASE